MGEGWSNQKNGSAHSAELYLSGQIILYEQLTVTVDLFTVQPGSSTTVTVSAH